MADPIVSPAIDLGRFDAPPVHGNYTHDGIAHVECASALATSLVGDGFDGFRVLNDKLQHDLLWLLAEELRRAKQALHAERIEQAAKRAQGAA